MAIGFGKQVWPVVSVRREGYRCKSQMHLMLLLKLKLKLKLGVLTVVESEGRQDRGHTEPAREQRVMNRLLLGSDAGAQGMYIGT